MRLRYRFDDGVYEVLCIPEWYSGKVYGVYEVNAC
jgi:hypothetical protein